MEAIIAYIQPFFGWLLNATLIGSIVVCLILLIQKMLGGKLGPRWCHALWLVLLIRMVLPWAPSSRLSLSNLIPSWDRQTQSQQSLGAVEVQETALPEQPAEISETMPGGEPEPEAATQTPVAPKPSMVTEVKAQFSPWLASVRRLLPILWLAGAIVIGAYLLISDLALWRIVKRDRPLLNQSMLELFEECKVQMGVQSLVAVVPSEQVRSPGLFGFIRPRLLLPREMLDTATREEMRYVFLHELAHLRRHDIYLGWLASLLQVLHWFNPLVWFAFYRMRADRELACDALVLTRTGQDKSQEYGGAILGLVRRFSRLRPLPAMAGIMESKSQLKRRIAMITQFKNRSYRFSPLAAVLIVILACISLPDAIRTKASETTIPQAANQPNFRKILIPTKPGNGVLSPDGEKLAFVSEGSVWVVPVHGKVSPDIAGEPVRLTGTEGAWNWGMRWSADGKWIAYNTLPSEDHAGICIVPSSGGKVKRIVDRYRAGVSLHNYLLSLSPDGKIVAFTSQEKGKIQLFTVNVEGSDVKQLTEDGGAQPAFSPDGNKISYVKEKPQKTDVPKSDVWVIPAAGGTPVQVSDLPGKATGPIWSPDGKMIAFTRKVTSLDSSKEICIVPVSETGKPEASPTQIELPLETWDFIAGWTQDNKIGVLLTNPEHRAVYTVPASGGNATQVTPQGDYYSPRWSPDGKRIYLRSPDGPDGIASVPSEGGEISISPIDADSMIGGPLQWGGNVVSPDGKKMVFCASKKDNKPYSHTHIYTIPVEGGEPEQLTITPGWDRFPCWSPDGKSIAFIRYSNASWDKKKHDYINNICIVRPEGGEVRQLTSESDKVARATIAWSPDGKSIAYYSEDKTIRVIPVQGGESRVVAEVDKVNEWWDELAWSHDGGELVYSSKGSIWVVSSDGGEPEEIKTGLDAKATHISWSPDGRKLAFTAITGGDEDLYLMENFLPTTAVAKPEPMTTVRRIESDWGTFASLSPDGKYLCDVDWDTENLAVLELATGKTRHLTDKSSDDACYPLESAISPDSRQVAYLWWDPDTKASSLHVVGLDGSGRRLLCEGKYPMPREWSADGKKILAVISENDVQQLVWVSASDGSVQSIASFDGESLGYPGKFDISSDGRFIAYDRPQAGGGSKRDIVVFDLVKNVETSLVEHPADDRLLGWTPDGKQVFFASDRTSSWDAWLLRVADGKPQGFPKLAKHGIGDVRPMGFTPYGSYYYAHERILEDVFTARLDLDTGEVLSEPVPVCQTGATVSHDFSPDGRYLAYCTQRPDESQAIHIRTLATGRERILADDLPYIRWLRWSLDGRSMLFDGYKRGDSQGVIFKIDVQTGERSDLVRSETEVLIRPEMSTDGKTLYYDRNDPKSRAVRLMARDLESGREKELLRIDPPTRLTGSALSPDGRQFVLSIVPGRTGADGPVLKILSTAGGLPKDLVQFKISEKLRAVGVTWMPDSRNVIFWKWHEHFKDLELWRVSAEGGEPRRLWSQEALGHVRVHPDGQRIAFYDRATTRAVWVMENFLPTELGK